MRRAFTLIELLVVIAIIAVLASLILVGVGIIRDTTGKSRLRAALATVRQGLTASAVTGARVAPAVHPFASTAPPAGIPVFLRAGTEGFVKDAAVSTVGILLDNPVARVVSASRPWVILPDDLFSGVYAAGDAPHLTGLSRRELMVLGSAAGLIDHMALPDPRVERWSDRNNDGLCDTPYTWAAYMRSRFGRLEPGNLANSELDQTGPDFWTRVLGPETAEELTRSGYLQTAPRTWPLGANNRVRLPPLGAISEGGPSVMIPSVGRKDYRLRGTSLVDPWGTEILAYTTADGVLILESAGEDRIFRGTDGSYAADNLVDPTP
jgi:prepilin-type N-terminal cleavage/methylation domain-containing protein